MPHTTAGAPSQFQQTAPPAELPKPAEEPGQPLKGGEAAVGEQVSALNLALEVAFFEYDEYRLRADAIEALRRSATILASELARQPDVRLLVEGHCDERGSGAYNIGLGEARAQKAKEFLAVLGLPAGKIDTISYGEERPQCSGTNEACWQKNRRAHLTWQTVKAAQ
jgi:peptidoglycan-associated lipoprotein